MESKVKWVKLGSFIEQLYEKNSDKKFGESEAIGVNIDKEIRPMKGHLDNKNFESFFVVRPCSFVYNPRGSRKLGLGYNDTQYTYITTFNNVIFHIKDDIKVLNPLFLFLYLSRKEWDRKAEYMSWGSSTEVFSWNTLCDIEIPLPSLSEQQKVVNAWKAFREIKEQNEAKAAPLMQLCQSYIQELKHKYPAQEIGPYIEEYDLRNKDSRYKIEDVRGISIEKKIIDTKANMDGVSLSPYKIFKNGTFCYVTITSRNGDKITLSLNPDGRDYIVSSSYITFDVKNSDVILPEFLYLWFCRPEFDRYARFNSWGSAREAFSFDDMKRTEVPIPPLDVQRAIVNIYKCANEAKQIAAEADRLSREVCPALLQHIINI